MVVKVHYYYCQCLPLYLLIFLYAFSCSYIRCLFMNVIFPSCVGPFIMYSDLLCFLFRLFLSLPCLIRILVPQHSFCFHLHAIFFSLTFSQCVLSSKENLCEQHNDGSSFLFSQPSYVFWLEYLVYWCLKLLLIGTNIAILLPVFWLLLQFFSVLSFISRLTCGLIIFFSVTFGLSP